MKELIVFSLVMIFIACQNQPHSKSNPVEQSSAPISSHAQLLENSLNCTDAAEEVAMDVAKELEHPTKPGIYYRETAMRSEATMDAVELACLSEITSSDESDDASLSTHAAVETKSEVSNSWQTLTQKWEIVQQKRACRDLNATLANPSCEDSLFMAEDGKLFSTNLDETLAVTQL